MYDYNLLVMCSWRGFRRGQREVASILTLLGDDRPLVRRTLAQGVLGVKTLLDPRTVIFEIRRRTKDGTLTLSYTHRWWPVDTWTPSDLASMKEGVVKMRERILKGEHWRMTVEKRRYTLHHTTEIIKELAELIDEKVDLKNPDKVLHIDIIGGYAGISVLEPEEIFSAAKEQFQSQ